MLRWMGQLAVGQLAVGQLSCVWGKKGNFNFKAWEVNLWSRRT